MTQNNKKLGLDLIAAMRAATPDKRYIAELIAKGADVNVANAMSDHALYFAVFSGNADIVKMLLQAGADPERGSSSVNSTALSDAAQWGHTACVDVLIQHQARLNVQDQWGYTPLMWAAYRGHKDIVIKLIAAGADVSLVNKGWHDAAYLAWSVDQDDICTLLKKAAAEQKEKARLDSFKAAAAKGFLTGKPIKVKKINKKPPS